MNKMKNFLGLIWLWILVISSFPAIIVQAPTTERTDNVSNFQEAAWKGIGVTKVDLYEAISKKGAFPLATTNSIPSEIKSENVDETNHTESCVREPMNTPETANVSGTIFAETYPVSNSLLATYSRHLMCKDQTGGNPIDPTTTFFPSDAKAGVLMTVTVSSEVVSDWYYRNGDQDGVWDYYGRATSSISGTWHVFHYTPISGNPNLPTYPRGWKIEVYLDGTHHFDEYFEITNDGRQTVTCGDVVSSEPVNIKSTFAIGVDPQGLRHEFTSL